MNDRDYWEQRANADAQKAKQYADRKAALITRWFKRVLREMDRTAEEFYRRYARENQISLTEAKRLLADPDLLRVTLETYQALADDYTSPETQAILDRIQTARKISRLESFGMQLELLAAAAYDKYRMETAQTLAEMYEAAYYKQVFDRQQLAGEGSAFRRISVNQIQAAVNTDWSGRHYSKRIWDQQASLARRINRILTSGMAAGRSNEEMSQELAKAMDASMYNVRRLISTESSAITNRAALDGYAVHGTGRYRFLATLDLHTSEICRRMDGKSFPVEDAKTGVNCPPMHPFCRSRTVPDEPRGDGDTRAARGPDGESYKVPADMTYAEWHKQYIESDPEAVLTEKMLKNFGRDSLMYQQYRTLLGKDAPKILEDFQRMKYTDNSRWDMVQLDYARRNRLLREPERKLPNVENATATDEKFTRYLFNPENSAGYAKGLNFTHRLGYDRSNWKELRAEILFRADKYPSRLHHHDQYGDHYEQRMILYGNTQNPTNVIIGWTVNKDACRLSTAFIKEVQ